MCHFSWIISYLRQIDSIIVLNQLIFLSKLDPIESSLVIAILLLDLSEEIVRKSLPHVVLIVFWHIMLSYIDISNGLSYKRRCHVTFLICILGHFMLCLHFIKLDFTGTWLEFGVCPSFILDDKKHFTFLL